jgi:hypothetical protein
MADTSRPKPLSPTQPGTMNRNDGAPISQGVFRIAPASAAPGTAPA